MFQIFFSVKYTTSLYPFSGMETASHAGNCPINLVNVLYKNQDKSGENRSKCLVVGSMFPHHGLFIYLHLGYTCIYTTTLHELLREYTNNK